MFLKCLVLIVSTADSVSETQCLHQIYVDEMYGSQDEQSRQKEKEEEKKKYFEKFI